MKEGKAQFIFFVFLTGIINVIVFITNQPWLILVTILLAGLIILYPKFTWDWFPGVYLISNIVISVLGILNELSSALLLASVACAFVTWELSDILNNNDEKLLSSFQIKFHKNRFLSLIMSVGLGLICAEILLSVQLNIPFIGMLFLALLSLFALIKIFLTIRDSGDASE